MTTFYYQQATRSTSSDVLCSTATTRTLESVAGSDRGHYTAVTIGADGLPLISY